MTGEKFYAKILLFGEYSLMVGSQALSIPYFDRYGRFITASDNETNLESQQYLSQFLHFLQKNASDFPLDLTTFEKELKDGLAFETNIPIGYGLGSSGALVAAVYDRYATEKSTKLQELKKIFSAMEAFFHGKSSGLDPLVCYLKQPVWVTEPDTITTVPGESTARKGNHAFFMIDSQQTGETQPLVDYFTRQCESTAYLNRIQQEMIPANNQCIASWLKKDPETFFPAIKTLSQLSLELFGPMIPEGFESLWKKGLAEDLFSLKLCGSGGGGMILGFAKDFQAAQQTLSRYPIHLIQNF